MRSAVLLLMMLAAAGVADAATVQPLVQQPPSPVGLPLLLTDGTVMFQDAMGSRWWKLTPDATGSYLHGRWTALASFPAAWNYAPYAFASAVLADGRVLIEGGEYNPPDGPFPLTNKGAIYDPVADAWAAVTPPPGWGFIGDSSSIVMPNGKFVLGGKLDMRIAELDPATMAWTELGTAGKADFNAEEGWTLLPDGSFLTVDVLATPNTERYTYIDAPGQGQWTSAGPTPVSLTWNYGLAPVAYPGGIYDPPGETGPASCDRIARSSAPALPTRRRRRSRTRRSTIPIRGNGPRVPIFLRATMPTTRVPSCFRMATCSFRPRAACSTSSTGRASYRRSADTAAC